MTAADLEATALALETANMRPGEASRRFARAWNAAAAAVPGWPDVTLPLARHPRRWTTRVENMPEPLRGEVEAFLARAEAALRDPFPDLGDLFPDKGPAEGGPFGGRRRRRRGPRCPATIAGWRLLIRAYVTALAEAGVPPERRASLRDIVGYEPARTALNRLVERSPTGNRRRALSVAHLLVRIARDHLRLGPREIELLASLREQTEEEREEGLTPKNLERLRPFRDERLLRRLLGLPDLLMRRAAAAGDDGSGRTALEAQAAAAIGLLLAAPMRVGNLARLRLDRHLAPGGGRDDGPAIIEIDKAETKNRRPLTFPLSPEPRRLLAAYLRRFRPRLAAPGAPWLFPGRDGRTHKTAGSLSRQIGRVLRRELGAEMHPHLFRHLAAMVYLARHPGDYETVRRLLGHKSLQTTTKYYCSADMVAAVLRYDEVVLGLRGPPRDRRGPPRRAGGRR